MHGDREDILFYPRGLIKEKNLELILHLSYYIYSDDSLIRGPVVRKSHLSGQKVWGFPLLHYNGQFSNPENSLIRKYRPGTNMSG